MTTQPLYAWHFVGDTLRDGRPVPKDGELLKHPGRPIPCESGLHASVDPYDALKYAPGNTFCLVKCGGEIVHHADDKLVCTERTIVARMDAAEMLRYFARMQALSVAHLWTPPDVVIDFLMTGDNADAAADAARAAARAADAAYAFAAGGGDATAAAAYAAAAAAAAAAAYAAARAAAYAAYDAARTAARAAADAARAAARQEFNALVAECFEGVKR
jgi:hypothetical protein